MKKIILYSAVSLDGFIARENGELDWLDALPNPGNIDYGYGEFYSGIDTVVMGRRTYEEVLGFGVEWPYPDRKSYVVSHKTNVSIQTPNTYLLHGELTQEMEKLKNEKGKNIWLAGGGILNTSFLNADLVDEMIITVMPIIIGAGLPLFPNAPKETKFKLKRTTPFESGAVNLEYEKCLNW